MQRYKNKKDKLKMTIRGLKGVYKRAQIQKGAKEHKGQNKMA